MTMVLSQMTNSILWFTVCGDFFNDTAPLRIKNVILNLLERSNSQAERGSVTRSSFICKRRGCGSQSRAPQKTMLPDLPHIRHA
jgi:hypothetical protein